MQQKHARVVGLIAIAAAAVFVGLMAGTRAAHRRWTGPDPTGGWVVVASWREDDDPDDAEWPL